MWAVSVHDGSGSTAEAVDVVFAVAIPLEVDAEKFAETLNTCFEYHAGQSQHSPAKDMWAQHFEIPLVADIQFPTISAADWLRESGENLPKGKTAIDLKTWVGEFLDAVEDGADDWPTMKTPVEPVSDDEEQAALNSILRGGAHVAE